MGVKKNPVIEIIKARIRRRKKLLVALHKQRKTKAIITAIAFKSGELIALEEVLSAVEKKIKKDAREKQKFMDEVESYHHAAREREFQKVLNRVKK